MEPRFDDRDVAAILGGILDVNAKLAEINVEVRTIRVLLWRTAMKKKRKRPEPTTDEEYARLREQHDRTQRVLAERIAYHEARIAERERAADEQSSGS